MLNLVDRVIEHSVNHVNEDENKTNYKETFYNLVRQSPNFIYLNRETTNKLLKLIQPQANLKFNPLKLNEICRQTLVSKCSSRVNIKMYTSIRYKLPPKIISFLFYEQELLEIVKYIF
jgi:hypothetical protein